MKNGIIIFGLIIGILIPCLAISVETAPRISDREIVERLTRLEEGQKNLDKRIEDFRSEMNSRFDGVRSEMNNRFDGVRSEMNSRFDTLQWMFGFFITIAVVILGFVLRMQWQMHKRQTQIETTLETHRDELAFLKGLIEKLLPPKSVL